MHEIIRTQNAPVAIARVVKLGISFHDENDDQPEEADLCLR